MTQKSDKKKPQQIADTEENLHDPALPLTDHLAELRKRIMIVLAFVMAVFVTATVVEFNFGQPIMHFFRRPLDLRNIPLVFDELTEPFMTYMRVGLYTALFLTFPITLSQIWLFLKPALMPNEQKTYWPMFIVSFPLFIGGGMFGYFVFLPFGYDFFLSFMDATTLPTLRMGDYLSLTVHLLFAFGIVFEMPVVIYFLTKMEIIDAEWLQKNRRISIVLCFVVAAVLTPPDVFSQMMMAIPLMLLYELSVIVSRVAAHKPEKTE